MAFLQFSNLFVAAYPAERTVHIARDDAPAVVLGEHASHRTVVVVFCMSYAFLLALAQGYRAGRMAGRKTSARFSDILVFAQGLVSTAFVFAVGINSVGLGLSTDAQCHAAIRVCIAMYGAAKITLYLFLLERVHIVRAPFIDRVKDPVWVIGAFLTVGGFASITGCEFIAPRSDLSRVDGICRIGIHPDFGIAIIALDTTINVALAGMFFWQLRPALGPIAPWTSSYASNSTGGSLNRPFLNPFRRQNNEGGRTPARAKSQRNLKVMLLRNVVGTTLVLCATITNNALFLTSPFATRSHACLLLCLTDIVLGMLVTNWLTMRSTTETIDASEPTDSTSGMASAVTRRPTMDFTTQNDTMQVGIAEPVPAAIVVREIK